ncbi:MAG: IS1595 family transposase [bacterium]|nr:IS1595 family transposase [bacterium]
MKSEHGCIRQRPEALFHRTRVPLLMWFWAIFFLARHKKGISALQLQLQRDTGVGSYQTAWTMLHKLRSALRRGPAPRLVGLVEVDEAFVGGRERGRRGGREVLNKSIVVAAVEQRAHSAGRVRLEVLKRLRFEENLGPFVRGTIDASKATVRTDGYAGYVGLEAEGIRHERCIQGSDRARSSEILPWVHTVFGNLKTWLRGSFHRVSGKHLQLYLDEFAYRFDRRWREGEMFGFILARAVHGEPWPYHRLTAESVG